MRSFPLLLQQLASYIPIPIFHCSANVNPKSKDCQEYGKRLLLYLCCLCEKNPGRSRINYLLKKFFQDPPLKNFFVTNNLEICL